MILSKNIFRVNHHFHKKLDMYIYMLFSPRNHIPTLLQYPRLLRVEFC